MMNVRKLLIKERVTGTPKNNQTFLRMSLLGSIISLKLAETSSRNVNDSVRKLISKIDYLKNTIQQLFHTYYL